LSDKKKTPGKRSGTSGRKTTRDKAVRVKTARGRKASSTRWLKRHLNDPYVREAERLGYRSRAAFKLLDIDEKFNILKPGQVVVDLGAAPGGWSQILAEKKMKKIVAIDLLPVDDIGGVDFMVMDFTEDDAPDRLKDMIGDEHDGKVDLVLSDMAANLIGHRQTDHLRMVMLLEMAVDFAMDVLKPGGHFIAKAFQGGMDNDFMALLKQNFESVKPFKPKSSRKESPEQFICAMKFKGKKA
jgi:23S rRNA (uridine2552-2'-O)-methyltransferase